MSCDLQRIVLTFVPSFDPCSQLPLSNLTSSAAANCCSILFTSTPNRHPATTVLMSCSLVATPRSPCVAAYLLELLYTLARVASLASLCSSTASVPLHPSFIPPFFFLKASPLPPSLIAWLLSWRCHCGPSLGGRLNGVMEWGRRREIEGFGGMMELFKDDVETTSTTRWH